MNINFNEEARIVHENNKKWWIDIYTGAPLERNKFEMLMLVITELAEAAEGERKNLMDDHLPTRKMAEVELADAFIRMLDFAGGFNYNIQSEIINEVWNEDIQEIIKIYELPENKLQGLLDICLPVVILGQMLYGNASKKEIEEVISAIFFFILGYARIHNYDIIGAYREKNEYNKTRKDHSIEERLKENGKKV